MSAAPRRGRRAGRTPAFLHQVQPSRPQHARVVAALVGGELLAGAELEKPAAAKHGKTVRREEWRLVIPIHIADSREEALNDVREGHRAWNVTYFEETLGRARAPEAQSPDPERRVHLTVATEI